MAHTERHGIRTADLLKQKLTERPLDVAQILFEHAIGATTKRLATLKRGEQMCVITPEPTSVQLWLTGDFEPEVTATLEILLGKGMIMWNIGAHIGTRVVQADKLLGETGHILAFEPTPRTKQLLDENSKQRTATVRTFPCAIGNQNGTTSFRDYGWFYSGLNTAGEKSRFQPRPTQKRELAYQKITTDIFSIDGLSESGHLNGPDILVIDTEGFELQVFKGGQKTLSVFKPLIIFETGDLGESDTIGCLNNLAQLGYCFFEYKDGVIEAHARQERYPEQGNLIAVHPEAQRGVKLG